MRRAFVVLALTGLGVVSQAAASPPSPPIPDPPLVHEDASVSWVAGLDDLLPLTGLRGAATITVQTWAASNPAPYRNARTTRFVAENATLGGLPLGKLTAIVVTSPGHPAWVTLTIEAPFGTLRGQLNFAGRSSARSAIPILTRGALAGTLTAENIDLEALSDLLPGFTASGKADLTVTLSETMQAPSVAVAASCTGLRWRGAAFGTLSLLGVLRDGALQVRLSLGDPLAPRGRLSATLPLRVSLSPLSLQVAQREPIDAKLTIAGINRTELALVWPLIPRRVDVDGTLAATVGGTMLAPKASALFEGFINQGVGRTPFSIAGELSDAKQRLRARFGDDLAVLKLESAIDGPLFAADPAAVRRASVRGQLAVDLPLEHLAAQLRGGLVNPSGKLRGRIEVAGSLGRPTFSGRLDVKDAQATFDAANRRLSDIDLGIRFDGDEIILEQFSGRSAPGTVHVTGSMRLNTADRPEAGLFSGWRATGSAKAVLDRFPIVAEGFPVSLARGRVDLTVDATPLDSRASVEIRGAQVEVLDEQLPETTEIPENGRVVFRTQAGTDPMSWRASPLAGRGRLRLDMRLIDPMTIAGDDIDMTLSGAFTVDRNNDVVAVDGGFQIAPGGRFDLFDNRFEIRAGSWTIAEGIAGATPRDRLPPGEAGALDPTLDLVARAKVIDTDVLVKVRGPMRSPELVLVSVPALPEYQIMTLLILGRVDSVDDRSGTVRRQVANLVRRYHNPGLKAQLFAKVGLDKLEVKFGSSVANPIVNVGKQINRQLFVETLYHHNAPPDVNGTEVHVEYRVASRWTLDTVIGDAGEGSLGAFWGTTYGGRKPPPPPGPEWGTGDIPRHREDVDHDGIPNHSDRCRITKEDPDGFDDEDGCPDKDNDRDGIADTADAAPNAPETFNGLDDTDGKPDETPAAPLDLEVAVEPMRFRGGSATLEATSRQRLSALLRALAEVREVRFELLPLAARGSRDRTRKNAIYRASTVREALRRLGAKRATIKLLPPQPPREGLPEGAVLVRVLSAQPAPDNPP